MPSEVLRISIIRTVFQELPAFLGGHQAKIATLCARLASGKHGQGEENTKMYLILPLLKMLGYDPTEPDHCDWEACGFRGGQRRTNEGMYSDVLLKPTLGFHIPVEIKPVTWDHSKLLGSSGQLARNAMDLQSRFGIMTNGRFLQLFRFDGWEDPSLNPRIPIWEVDLCGAPKKDWGTLANLHRSLFTERYWESKDRLGDNQKRNHRNPLLAVTLPGSAREALKQAIGEKSMSKYCGDAIRTHAPHLGRYIPGLRRHLALLSNQRELFKPAIRTRMGLDEDLLQLRRSLPSAAQTLLGASRAPGFASLAGFCVLLMLNDGALPIS